jgi:8-oxo-dGTP pyrophosphatase MutT (NUDIX family)
MIKKKIMSFSNDTIRFLVVAVIKKGDRLFLSQGFDPVKQEGFYRAMGGGVDFGESSFDALQREFQEEISAELTNIKYLGCLESIFQYKGITGHEVIQVYQADFTDDKFYQLESINFQEKDREKTALWVKIEDIKSGKLKLVPDNFINFLS